MRSSRDGCCHTFEAALQQPGQTGRESERQGDARGHLRISSVERDTIQDAPAPPTRAGYQRAWVGERVESSSDAGRLGHLLSFPFNPQGTQTPQAAVLARSWGDGRVPQGQRQSSHILLARATGKEMSGFQKVTKDRVLLGRKQT